MQGLIPSIPYASPDLNQVPNQTCPTSWPSADGMREEIPTAPPTFRPEKTKMKPDSQSVMLRYVIFIVECMRGLTLLYC